MKVLVITDNEYIFQQFQLIIEKSKYAAFEFIFRFSPQNKNMFEKYSKTNIFAPIDVKIEVENIIKNYDMVFSLHCKQIFPAKLVNSIKCINVHPGFNPQNRGWFPQVFSIINKLDCGVTIHYMDELLDHGKVLFQEKVKMHDWDTSLSLYTRIQEKEIELLKKYLHDILTKKIDGYVVGEGNINTLKDFKKLCELDMDEKLTMKEAIDKLRALSHGEYKNAYFLSDNKKIFVKIDLEKKEQL